MNEDIGIQKNLRRVLRHNLFLAANCSNIVEENMKNDPIVGVAPLGVNGPWFMTKILW